MIGALFKNGSCFNLITNGYKMLNFVGAGYTTPYSGFLNKVTFPSPTVPIIFIRGARENIYTAMHSLQDHKNGLYTVYTLGESEVFAFSEVQSRSTYGMEIYDESHNLVYSSASIPISPVSVVKFPTMNKGESVFWDSKLGARKLAYCLAGNRGYWEWDLTSKAVNVWRDVVQSVSGGFILHSLQLADREYHNNPLPKNGFARVDQVPIQMTVIDVHDLSFPNMKSNSFY